MQITDIKNKRGDKTTDSVTSKRIIKEYSEQFYAYKFSNLDEMTKSLKDTKYQRSLTKK